MKLHDLSAPVAALALLMAGHRDLPAPAIDINTVYPDRLRLSFHDQPGALEQWTAALGIDQAAVTERLQNDGALRVRKATARYGGVDVHLIDYSESEAGR